MFSVNRHILFHILPHIYQRISLFIIVSALIKSKEDKFKRLIPSECRSFNDFQCGLTLSSSGPFIVSSTSLQKFFSQSLDACSFRTSPSLSAMNEPKISPLNWLRVESRVGAGVIFFVLCIWIRAITCINTTEDGRIFPNSAQWRNAKILSSIKVTVSVRDKLTCKLDRTTIKCKVFTTLTDSSTRQQFLSQLLS